MTAKATRRAILAGAVTLSALSLPAIAAGNPDAKLIELGRQLYVIRQAAHDRLARPLGPLVIDARSKHFLSGGTATDKLHKRACQAPNVSTA